MMILIAVLIAAWFLIVIFNDTIFYQLYVIIGLCYILI